MPGPSSAVPTNSTNLADKKDFSTLVKLLTEDAEVDFYFGEALVGSWKGRAQFEQALLSFSGSFEATYHVNGQQVIEVEGDNASSQHYCLAIQIASTEGKKT